MSAVAAVRLKSRTLISRYALPGCSVKPCIPFVRCRRSISEHHTVCDPSAPAADLAINRHERAGTVMLRPVEFQSSTEPGTGQSDQRGFDDAIVVNEVILIGLVQRHLDPAPQFGQDHDLQELVFQEHRLVRSERLLVGYPIDDGQRVDRSTGALINPLLEKHGIAIRRADAIGRDGDGFAPDANGRICSSRHVRFVLRCGRCYGRCGVLCVRISSERIGRLRASTRSNPPSERNHAAAMNVRVRTHIVPRSTLGWRLPGR